jgi:hypothetical protein
VTLYLAARSTQGSSYANLGWTGTTIWHTATMVWTGDVIATAADTKHEDAATAAHVGVAHVVTSEGATELAATGAGPTSYSFKCLS